MALYIYPLVCLHNENNVTLFGKCYLDNYIKYKKKKILITIISHVISNNKQLNTSVCIEKESFCVTIEDDNYSERNVYTINLMCKIDEMTSETKFENINLLCPFDNFDASLNPNESAIIVTMCKQYNHRLNEWIQYNLKLGFSAIVIFDNSKNTKSDITEINNNSTETLTIPELKQKYKQQLCVIEFSYVPIEDHHWHETQSISFTIGVNEFKNKCNFICLIDPDEFICYNNMDNVSIEHFLCEYDTTVTMKSNILTNKNEHDIVNNNVLELAEYIGEEKYTKTILKSNLLKKCEFLFTPHCHPTEKIVEKNKIMHYHCWLNERYQYIDGMEKITKLQEFYKN